MINVETFEFAFSPSIKEEFTLSCTLIFIASSLENNNLESFLFK